MTHESSNEQRGNFSPWLFFTPCTSVKCQKTQEGLVLFGCQPGFRVYISRLLTDPSCTQIGQVLLVFFLALQWLPSPLILSYVGESSQNPQDGCIFILKFLIFYVIFTSSNCLFFHWSNLMIISRSFKTSNFEALYLFSSRNLLQPWMGKTGF